MLTLSLLLFTLVSSSVGLIHAYTPNQALALLHLTALYASRLSVPSLAIFLVLLYRSPQYSPTVAVTALFLQKGPILSLTTLLLLLTPYSPTHFLVFGPAQDVLSLVVNFVALIPTLVCLILISKSHNNDTTNSKNDRKCNNGNNTSFCDNNNNNKESSGSSGSQRLRHTTLLILLAISMFTSIALSLHRFVLILYSLFCQISSTFYSSKLFSRRTLKLANDFPGAISVLVCINATLSSGYFLFSFLSLKFIFIQFY